MVTDGYRCLLFQNLHLISALLMMFMDMASIDGNSAVDGQTLLLRQSNGVWIRMLLMPVVSLDNLFLESLFLELF
jgi:hypothetical protein